MKTTRMIKFTKEMVDKIDESNLALIGTSKFATYHMEREYLQSFNSGRRKWKFDGFGIPHNPGVIKFTAFGTFIYNQELGSYTRYKVSAAIYDLLELDKY